MQLSLLGPLAQLGRHRAIPMLGFHPRGGWPEWNYRWSVTVLEKDAALAQ